MIKNYLFAFSLGLAVACSAPAEEADNLVPTPRTVTTSDGAFTFGKGMAVSVSDESLVPAVEYFRSFLPAGTLAPETQRNAPAPIRLRLLADGIPQGGYRLKVSRDSVSLEAADYPGIIAGMTTIRQLLPADGGTARRNGIAIQTLDIADHPRFGWRGVHLDVSRHFYSKEEIKKLLDLMTLYKFNKFHWHLTDDQGWRIEIKHYPLLTEKGAWRRFNSHDRTCMQLGREQHNPDYDIPADKIRIADGDSLYGGFYTREDIREIVQYAGKRGIDVVPEIDMPGHFFAAIEQYPEVACNGPELSSSVCPGQDRTMTFCKDIWQEVFELFPYEYAHIGGDEVVKDNWNRCSKCRERIRKEGLKDADALQAWFIREMERFFNANGKKLIGWDEIVGDGLNSTSVISWWRSWCGDAVNRATGHGMKAILCPNSHLYFDYAQQSDNLKKIYEMDPYPAGLSDGQKELVMGVQCNIWCEWIPSLERMEYMTAPRLLAVSELGWCAPEQMNDYGKFESKVMNQIRRLDRMGIHYRIPDLTGFYDRNVFVDEGRLDIACPLPGIEIRYTTDGSFPTAESPLYTGPVSVNRDTRFNLLPFRPDGTAGDLRSVEFRKETYAPARDVQARLAAGLLVSRHDYRGNDCREIAAAPCLQKLTADRIGIPRGITGGIALLLTGYIDIPEDGIYTFALLSDDGSILTIDGSTLIDNNGLHSPEERTAQRALAKGLHAVEVSYFDYNGGILKLYLLDGKGNRTECPADWFRHAETERDRPSA